MLNLEHASRKYYFIVHNIASLVQFNSTAVVPSLNSARNLPTSSLTLSFMIVATHPFWPYSAENLKYTLLLRGYMLK